MTYRKFSDASVRPPRGGWSYPIAGVLTTRYSEDEILQEMVRWNRNNSTGKTEEQLRAELWTYFCANQPDRCGHGSIVVTLPDGIEPPTLPLIAAVKTPELQGPPIWGFLNTLASQWNPALHDYFLSTCDAIISILDCPICQGHWSSTLGKYPPRDLKTRAEVCRWVNMVHNRVNEIKGKQSYPYSRMVTEWGAPP